MNKASVNIDNTTVTLVKSGRITVVNRKTLVERFASAQGDVNSQIDFPNGWGASVIRHDHSYGGRSGLFEFAVLKDGELNYTSGVTGDVVGWCPPEEIADLVLRVAAL